MILWSRQLNDLQAGQIALTREIATQSAEIAALKRMITSLDDKITLLGAKTMATLQDVQDAVAQETSVEQGVIALLNQLAGERDPAALQALVDQLNANSAAMAAAVQANTPQPSPQPGE